MQVPFELSPRTYSVTVTTSAGLSNSVDLNVTATSPGMFTGAVVSNKNGAQINAANPMHPGDVIVIYCTGLGAVSPRAITGQLASASPISSTLALPTVTIGGVPVQVANAVLSPGFVGVYQIGIVVPGGLPQGAQPLVVTSGGVVGTPVPVISAPSLNPQYCADVSGTWNVTQSGSVTETATSAIENVNVTDPFSGQGTINIVQAGCNISYTPIPVPGLITTDQAAALVRTGTVVGTTVSLHGLLTTQALAVSNQPDLTITQVSQNEFGASGQLTGAVLTTNDSGKFAGSGTYSANGQSGTFTLDYALTGSTTLLRAGVGPTVTAAPAKVNVQTHESAQAQSQTLVIGGTVGIGWQATVSTSSGDWLSIVPGRGQVPALPTATITPGSLPVGTYHGSIVIQALDVSPPSSATISVTLTIAGSTAAGTITTVAGIGPACEFNGSHCGGFSGDGGLATLASLNDPVGIAVDAAGNLFIADTYNDRIRKVSTNGTITTIAGSGAPGCPSNICFSGDNGPAASAQFHSPMGIAVDTSGNLFVADYLNSRVRKISVNGIITTVAGDATCCAFSGDGGPATSATLWGPTSVAVDAAGNIFIADATNNRIRKVSGGGSITTVAGSGKHAGFSGDGGLATSALLNNPIGVTVDASGNIFIADSYNNRIRKVSASGIITTVAGNGSATSGEGVPATSVGLGTVNAVAVDAAGNLFIGDGLVIQKVASGTGLITTVAGNGGEGFSGDGGLATLAMLNYVGSIAVDGSGNLLIADSQNNRIREVFQAAAPHAGAHSINSALRVGVGLTVPAGSAVFGSVAIPLQPAPLPLR
jgi:sugar lactone lactonase YvrE